MCCDDLLIFFIYCAKSYSIIFCRTFIFARKVYFWHLPLKGLAVWQQGKFFQGGSQFFAITYPCLLSIFIKTDTGKVRRLNIGIRQLGKKFHLKSVISQDEGADYEPCCRVTNTALVKYWWSQFLDVNNIYDVL